MSNDHIEIQEKKEAFYRKLVRPRLMDDLREKIVGKLVVEKKYKDASYTARQMAEELQTNVRYISAVVRVQFHTNYTTLVNKYRIEEAMSLLADQRYRELNIEDVSDMVGFAHRQSFYTAFVKFAGMTPNAYRQQFLSLLPTKTKADKNAKNKRKE